MGDTPHLDSAQTCGDRLMPEYGNTGTRPRILLITRNLPPLIGGMERLVQNLAEGASEWADLTVIGPRGCSKHLPDSVKVIETSEKLGGFLLSSLYLAIKAARQQRYALAIGGSGLAAPALWLLSRFYTVKTAVLLHGLDVIVDNAVYQRCFLPCIRRLDLIIANSRNTRNLAIERGVDPGKISIINPGTTLPDLPDRDTIRAFCGRHALETSHLIIFVGRMTRRKGLSRFIGECMPQLLETQPDATLLVVGDDPVDSLNRKGEEQEVLRAANDERLRGRIRFLGHVSDEDLTLCYAAADVQILPLVEVPGDVEGFGMIAIEAAACGTPTVAFELGGVPDAIGANNGALTPAGDYASFAEAVASFLGKQELLRERCREHAEQFAWPHYHARVESVLADLLRAGPS